MISERLNLSAYLKKKILNYVYRAVINAFHLNGNYFYMSMSLVTSDEMLEKLEVCVCSFSGLDSYQMGELGFFSLLSCPLLQLGWFCPLGWGPALAGQWGPAWSVNRSFAVLNHCCSLLTWITSKGHLLQSQTFY